VLVVILLDTHIWFWWINLEHHRFSSNLKESISSCDRVAVSCVSCYEIALAAQRGRLSLPLPAHEWFVEALENSGIELIPLLPSIAARAVTLSDVHRDPFDRIIIATTLEENATLASLDTKFREYPELNQILVS
jgi:PIN domain nuclease of toxin-antitoxin system